MKTLNLTESVERLTRLWPRVQGDHTAEQALRRRLLRDSDPLFARCLQDAILVASANK